ncbi:hypothetical protein DLK06_15820 [Acinetobacter pittii]|uniref:Replication protein n=1 Tax=Acinetobacter pittii TaxID=48296 RepID=A0AAE9S9W7_ACIPI|nr:hypothetical protein [Acinetobacter pittii]AZP30423.1 hypothetical protein DLK06_15820 [Acinetobacter pittii]RZH03863.1 hypothetical protein EXE01_01970 [Acinetobacter pittii]USU93807.1 hypothetical protein MWH18_15860 [Acinetobacter pittii]
MKTNLAHKHEPPQAEVLKFPKKERPAMSEKFDKGYVMSSRLYRNEVKPFLGDAARNVYAELEEYISGFNKESDFVSYSQLQGRKIEGLEEHVRKLSTATVRAGLKQLIEYGVISIVATNPKLGNKYKLNEISLVEHFSNKSTSETKGLQKLNSTTLETKAQGTLETKDTIDIIYRYLIIDNLFNSLRSNKPLESHFYVYQETQKQIILEQQKLEAEEKAKAEKERKDKVRKLSFDEVIKLTKNTFANLCDLELWEQYVANRSQQAKTKLTKNALNAIYKDFIEWGYEGANQSLKTSITGNYQGLFAPKQQNHGFVNQSQASTRMSEIQELIAKEEAGYEQYGF